MIREDDARKEGVGQKTRGYWSILEGTPKGFLILDVRQHAPALKCPTNKSIPRLQIPRDTNQYLIL
jgi:hypothetical protein